MKSRKERDHDQEKTRLKHIIAARGRHLLIDPFQGQQKTFDDNVFRKQMPYTICNLKEM